MAYYEVVCSNDYCGCDENFYIEAENMTEAEELAGEILEQEYSFYEPDGRFCDTEDEDEVEAYMEGCSADVREISEKEYNELKY